MEENQIESISDALKEIAESLKLIAETLSRVETMVTDLHAK